MIEETVYGLGGGLLFGFIAGYAFKKIVKIAAVIIGTFVLVLAYLSYKGWITANWDMIENQTKNMAFNATQQVINSVNEAATRFHGHDLLTTQATPIAGAVGFIVGFGLGVRK